MALKFHKYLWLFLSVIFLATATFMEHRLVRRHPEEKLIENFQKKLAEKESRMESYLSQILEISSRPGFSDRFLSEMSSWNHLLEKEGTGILIYRNNKLFYWSDRAIAFRNYLPLFQETGSPVVRLPNGYYLTSSLKNGSITVFGLILIKSNFSYQNQYLKNSFYHDFLLPEKYKLITPASDEGYPITNLKGETVFSILPQGELFCLDRQLYLPGFLFLTGLILLLVFAQKLISSLKMKAICKPLIIGGMLCAIYFFHIIFHFPALYSQIGFFSPAHFALSSLMPSLGDFVLFSFFIFYFFINFYWDFRMNPEEKKTASSGLLPVFLLLSLNAVAFLAADHFIRQLIYNSSFTYSLNKINEITVQTVLGIISIMLLLFGVILFTARITVESCKILPGRKIFGLLVIIIFLSGLFQLVSSTRIYPGILALLLIAGVLAILYYSSTSAKYGMSYLILLITAVTIYSLIVIYSTAVQKEREVQKLMAVNLVSEHDPAAELFLVEIQQQINEDPNIPRYLVPPFKGLDGYIERSYFSGFFRQYDLQVTICTGEDSLTLHPQNLKTPCFPFFDNLINNQGIPLPGTSFYYLDNMDGRITYLGKLNYKLPQDSTEVNVFIDLKSKIQSEGIGFPELLIDKSMQKPESYKRFDYAKYFGGELVDRHGSFPYNYYIYSYAFDDREFSYNIWDGYEHLIHRTDENNYVVVSRPLYSFGDYLISFPYLFVVYFLFSLFSMLFIYPGLWNRKMTFDLKFKIQAAIISIVFISLLLVALGTIFYNIEESRIQLQKDLDQKMNSIATEIDARLEDVRSISPEIREWLMPEMVKLSNVFETDINIYGIDGDLIVSSRPEIFNRGLVSKRISTQAYYELFENFQTNYFLPEKIGELDYLSAYEPIISNSGDYLGFINLPYFTHQDKYSQEISTFIVAFINLYVLLFLASIIVAIFIANQITAPLGIIRENLRKMELGKLNEPINYHKDDEIGKLVSEYNKKVAELAVSAELLARSERESAWREMAKQVAHEIKNPLTPMKLNIQHLQRFRGEGKDYQEYVNHITRILVDQIDTLSDIATEFSNFAQIPTAMKQVFNLSEQIGKVIDLYENDNRAMIHFEKNNCGDLLVNADREQLNRALINLIKNGIQAIPDEREGKIVISLNKKDHMIEISVADNGTGIPPELQEKMFSPNFTTKTSGMGLGLAIVKNIAENFNGHVRYETAMNTGTTFFLEIPVYEENETSVQK